MRRNRYDRRAAFTLLELLLVLAILVILGGTAVFYFAGTFDSAKRDSARSQINALKLPIQQFNMAYGRYPQSLEELYQPPPPVRAGEPQRRFIENPVGLDPWNNPYQYRFPGERNPDGPLGYDLWSLGADGQDGTADDIGNWIVQ